ncbi:MAG: hypothetical protein COV45_08930 [Deltaproteobacteria bacterium CG11_big_fil_rev_8_21_14_0_20_47_16]|nr:MAG: hypothetical protein COV45_08930 [Deltaproteobacteria bacterium CG11_big_fil_rev_8_21_14_0_20_47_16]
MAISNTSPPQAQPKTEQHIDPYNYHILGKQVGGAALGVGTSFFFSLSRYERGIGFSTLPHYQSDPFNRIYDPKNRIGALFQRLYLPREYLEPQMRLDFQQEMRQRGAQHVKIASRFGLAANVARTAGNVTTVVKCLNGTKCDSKKVGVAVADELAVLSWMGTQWYNIQGATLVHAAEEIRDQSNPAVLVIEREANTFFTRGTRFMIANNVLQVAVGSFKLWVEVDHFMEDPSLVNQSNVVDGAVDVGRGSAYWAYMRYLLNAASTEVASGNIHLANDVLSIQHVPIPPKILLSMRVFGIAGAGFSLVSSSYEIYDGVTNPELTPDQSQEQIISGSLGATSALAFMGAAYAVTAAAATVGFALTGVGFAFLAALTVYKIYKHSDDFFGSSAEEPTINVDLHKY